MPGQTPCSALMPQTPVPADLSSADSGRTIGSNGAGSKSRLFCWRHNLTAVCCASSHRLQARSTSTKEYLHWKGYASTDCIVRAMNMTLNPVSQPASPCLTVQVYEEVMAWDPPVSGCRQMVRAGSVTFIAQVRSSQRQRPASNVVHCS